ncbi:Alpha-adducin [Echinococcus granulosus]|uniref:Alpha-adducin n=1 Tax=Echinococcus granulosus TaxID=6210 RepID=W6U8A0_ECHGR|nr:Alpha-adducin [Echinococcus granulosus]EUB56596.1 Alpha-adducin [Echinococcus granulosus]
MVGRVVTMTPRTEGKVKTIQVVRDLSPDPSEVYHKGSGHLNGIIVNKENSKSCNDSEMQEIQLEFTCLMHNSRTEEGHAENRRLKFWFIKDTDRNRKLHDSYDFFKDLVNQETFPKDYVGFIKRMLKLLQSDRYPNLRRVDLDIVPLEPCSQDAFVPEVDQRPVELVVREGLLRTLEDAYPNVLSMDDLIRLTNHDDTGLLAKQLRELEATNFIQPVFEVIAGAAKLKSISDEQKPTVAIITNLLCEKLAVDSLIERKTTYIRYETKGDSNVYTIGYIGSVKVISVKLPMVGWERQAKISSGSITTRLLGTFQSIQHVILCGVGGSVPHVYEFKKHSRLGDIVVSAPSKEGSYPNKSQPWYIFCEAVDYFNGNASSIADGDTNQQKQQEVAFTHKKFAPKNSFLLNCAEVLLEVDPTSWHHIIKEGLSNLKDHEFNFNRPPAETDKLKIQIGDEMIVDVKHPEPPGEMPPPPLVRLGCIGSGHAVTQCQSFRDLFAVNQNLLAYDAEFDQVLESLLGSGVASFLIVRGIADYAEGRQGTDAGAASISWQPYAALSAAAFTRALVLKLQSMESPSHIYKMTENATLMNTSGDGPDMKLGPPSKQSDALGGALSSTILSSAFNTSGALQQLSEFLNMHARGGTMHDFKGQWSCILDAVLPSLGNTPTIPINDLRGDEAIRYTREERLVRCQLAALCHLIDLNGWTNSIYNQISAKCAEDEFLVNPFGLLYHEVQASTLVKVNSQGSVLDSGSTVLGVNKAGWNLHSAVHSTRSDINCVAHLHLPDVVAVSCIKSGLLPVSPEALELLPSVRYHDYAGIVTDATEADAIRADLGNAKILFLRNKGVTVAASTIPEAWYLMKRVISACQTQVSAVVHFKILLWSLLAVVDSDGSTSLSESYRIEKYGTIYMRLLQLGCGPNLLSEFVLTPAKSDAENAAEKAPEQSGDSHEAVAQNAIPFASESHVFANSETNGDDHVNGIGAKSTSSGVTDLSGWGVGEMDFEAQMRMLDSAGYRTGYAYRNPNLLRRPPSEVHWGSGTTPHQTDNICTTGFSADTTMADTSGIDDVTAATEAGARQISEIANTVRSNREKGVQRNQWLSKTTTDHLFVSQIPKHYQSTPMNGRYMEASVEELPTAAAIPPLNLSPSSPSTRKLGRRSKTFSSFSSRNRLKERHEKSELLIEEPRTPPIARSDLASKSASLPAHARNLVTYSARSCNTLEPIDGAASDDEELKSKVGKKKSKWGSFRFPTFKKKSKQASVAV